MLPYVGRTTFDLGPLTIQVWGLFAAIGVVAGTAFALREAKRRGLDPARAETLAFWTVILAFVGARLFHAVFYAPGWYAAHPAEILAVWKGGFSSFGGFIGASAAFLWKGRALGLPFLKTADAFVPAAFLGLGCGRIGCYLIHDHPGTLAHDGWSWLAVRYPDGARYDLGLLLGAADFLLFGALLALARRRRPDGTVLLAALSAYAPLRFGLDFLRADYVRYAGLTPAQWLCIALSGAALGLWRRTRRAT
jgi:phosphatidylglycerol:prolipoprotein diacylglycerol transferase